MAQRTKAAAKPAVRTPSRALVTQLQRIAAVVEDPLPEAQTLAFDALEAASTPRRLELAAQSLASTPLSPDAWSALASAAPEGSPLALQLWRQAVAAGILAIGPLGFLEWEGEFWGWMETRPYMRARQGLAEALWQQGEHDAAIAEMQDMLRLNPNDNQGIRHELMGRLLEKGRDAEAAALHERYREDDYPGMRFGAVLLALRREGEEPAAAALGEAAAANPHMAALLTGARPMPKRLPDYYSPGQPNEAESAWPALHPAWAATPGALDWLARQAGGGATPGTEGAKPVARRRASRRTGTG